MSEASKDLLIQDYLEGKLDGRSAKDFEMALQSDPVLAKEVEDYKTLDKELRVLGYKRFENTVQAWETEHRTTQQKKSKVINLRPYLALAAGVALALAVGIYLFLNQSPDLDELYAVHYTPYEDMILGRWRGETLPDSSLTGSRAALAEGMRAYNNLNFPEAEQHLLQYLKQNDKDPGIALYLGITQMEQNKFVNAELSFLKARENALYAPQSQWYLALMYLKGHRLEKCKTQLQSIAEDSLHYKRAAAKALLEDLE